jgi:hypothetical protein
MYYFFRHQGAHVWIGQQQAMRRFCALADVDEVLLLFYRKQTALLRVAWNPHNQRSPKRWGAPSQLVTPLGYK